MKLFKKFLKENNKGLSLVELVCAVAIFGLSTTAIGGAMVVSAQSYQRGTIELDVQKEAQSTTNLIGNLLVDAVDVQYVDADQKMTVTDKTGSTFEIKLDTATGELKYKQGSEEVVLAEGVNYFKVDRDDFDTSKNVEIDLKLSKGDREYQASYNTTARNGQMNPGAAMDTKIFIDNEVVLEPGQSYEFTALVSSSVNYGNLVWEFLDSSEDEAIFTTGRNSLKETIKLDVDATNDIAFKVYTSEQKDDGAGNMVPLDEVTGVIKVRRVTEFALGSVNHTWVSGTPFVAGSVCRVYGQVNGTNLEKQIGKTYDSDYVNPKYIDFKITGAEGGITVDIADVTSGYDKENSNLPYMEFKLLSDMPFGSKLIVTATAKHPAGWSTNKDGSVETKTLADGTTKKMLYNKTSSEASAYSYDTITYEHPIENDNGGASGIKRGDNAYWIDAPASVEGLDANLGNNYLTYMRIWPTDQAAYTNDDDGWILVNTTGTCEFKLEKKWTLMMDPRKSYHIEFLVAVANTSSPSSYADLVFPTPTTPRTDYITQTTVNRATLQMKCDAAGGGYQSSIGTKDAPIEVVRTDATRIDLKTTGMNFTNLEDKYIYTAEKWVVDDAVTGAGHWEATSVEKNDFMGDNDEHRYIEFKDQGDPVGTIVRVKVSINYPMYQCISGSWSENPVNIDLYTTDAGGEIVTGVMYFKLK